MRYLIILLLSFSAHAHEGFYIEAGVGKNDVLNKNNWTGRESMGCSMGAGFVYAPYPYLHFDAGFIHYSQCTRGNGFDDRIEDHLDSIYISGRYYF